MPGPPNPAKTYAPVGRCIYCGSEHYAPDSTRVLGLEHIIAEALSGRFELPAASCKKCEQAINPWETKLTRGQMWGARTFMGLDTKRPKQRPNKLPLFDTSVVPNRKVMVDLEDCPIFIMQATYDAPCVLSGVPLEFAATKIW